MSTPDPADRMRAVREAMREQGAKLYDAMRNADHNGNPTETTTDEETSA